MNMKNVHSVEFNAGSATVRFTHIDAYRGWKVEVIRAGVVVAETRSIFNAPTYALAKKYADEYAK